MKCKPLAIRYGIRFKTYLFPLTLHELADSLEKKGYEISSNLPFPRPPGRMTGMGDSSQGQNRCTN